MTPSINILRQSASLLLAHSVSALFPRTTVVNVKGTQSGFCCDFRTDQKLDEEALVQIEEKIRHTIFEDVPFKVMEMMRENAVSLLEYHKFFGLVRELKECSDNIVKIVQLGDFYAPSEDVVSTSKEVGFVKLLDVSENDGITRITGAVYPNQQKLKQFVRQWDKYQKVNHKKLGEELNLFFESGEWSWQPKGSTLLDVLMEWWKGEHRKQGFSSIRGNLHKIFKREDVTNARYCQLAAVKGEHQSSLFENAPYTQDQSFIFCLAEQVPFELTSSLQFFEKTSNIFGFEAQWYLVVPESGKKNFDPLVKTLEEEHISYTVEKRQVKPTTPRIEGRVVDLLGREWPLYSLSLDDRKQCLIVRQLFGSFERVAALLVEKHAGQFPLWLAPEQVRIIPVKNIHSEYGEKVREKLVEAGYRVGYHLSEDKLSSKIHSAVQNYVPCMLIVGDEEVNEGRVTVRSWNKEDAPRSVTLDELLEELGTIIGREKNV